MKPEEVRHACLDKAVHMHAVCKHTTEWLTYNVLPHIEVYVLHDHTSCNANYKLAIITIIPASNACHIYLEHTTQLSSLAGS